MKKSRPTKKLVHKPACNGGIEFVEYCKASGKPIFRCTKCRQSFCYGKDGRPYAVLLPKNR